MSRRCLRPSAQKAEAAPPPSQPLTCAQAEVKDEGRRKRKRPPTTQQHIRAPVCRLSCQQGCFPGFKDLGWNVWDKVRCSGRWGVTSRRERQHCPQTGWRVVVVGGINDPGRSSTSAATAKFTANVGIQPRRLQAGTEHRTRVHLSVWAGLFQRGSAGLPLRPGGAGGGAPQSSSADQREPVELQGPEQRRPQVALPGRHQGHREHRDGGVPADRPAGP